MATEYCPKCSKDQSRYELDSGICFRCGETLVGRENGKVAKPAFTPQRPCALCGQCEGWDCFLRGVIREGGVLALPHQSKLRFYYVKCPCCDACFGKVARFNRIRTRGLLLGLLSLALGLGGLPLLDWLADTSGIGVSVPGNVKIAAGVVGVIGMFVVLGITSQWVRDNQGTLLNPQIDQKLRQLAQVDHWTGTNFPNFTRRPIDNKPHDEL